jgi:hypothetical protein
MILFILMLMILGLELITIRNYKKDLESCYRVLLKQQKEINELESKLNNHEKIFKKTKKLHTLGC